jgi:hypothetical protein
MRWTDVDGAREHLNPRLFAATNGKRPTRKAIYKMIAAGMKVVRRGDAIPRKDSKGRMRQGRITVALEWMDEFMVATAESLPSTDQDVVTMPARRRA